MPDLHPTLHDEIVAFLLLRRAFRLPDARLAELDPQLTDWPGRHDLKWDAPANEFCHSFVKNVPGAALIQVLQGMARQSGEVEIADIAGLCRQIDAALAPWPGDSENVEQDRDTRLHLVDLEVLPSYSLEPENPVPQEAEGPVSGEIGKLSFSKTSLSSINDLIGEAVLAEESNNYLIAASRYEEVAKLLKQEQHYVKARDSARKSANCFLKANRQEDAVRRYLLAAKIWMNHTAFADTLAIYDLEKAQEIATQTSNFALLAQVYLLQAQYSILRGNKSRMQKMWQEVEELLPKVHPDTYIPLATEYTVK